VVRVFNSMVGYGDALAIQVRLATVRRAEGAPPIIQTTGCEARGAYSHILTAGRGNGRSYTR